MSSEDFWRRMTQLSLLFGVPALWFQYPYTCAAAFILLVPSLMMWGCSIDLPTKKD